MMKSTMKRMVLTGAAVALMMSFAAPALAEEEKQLNICERVPELCSDDLPVLEPVSPSPPPPPPPPPDKADPPVADPPGKNDPVVDPGKDNPDNEESDTGGSGDGGGGGGGIGSASETLDRGGTFVSGFLPTAPTSTIGEAGNSVKKNLPASVAKSLPNTGGGGWTFVLLLVAAGLIAGAFLARSIVRRTTSVRRTAQQ